MRSDLIYIKKLKNNIKNFVDTKDNHIIYGWGRKKTGNFALWLSKILNKPFLLLEDGFIRSIGLGVDGWDSFSVVKDDIGIYYDATKPSRLEEILNTHSFDDNTLTQANHAIELIKKYKISKYNNSTLSLPAYLQTSTKKLLIIAQTKRDKSLEYGLVTDANEMIKDALRMDGYEVYLKIHPDVLSGKKDSSIDIEYAKKYCKIIDDNINPIVLLEAFDVVYTQTSQMGFEALLLGKEIHTYGMPFYAGWGATHDKIECKRRTRQRSTPEIFAAAYILYSHYYNPYSQKPSNIIDTIETIHRYRQIYKQNDGRLYMFGFTPWKRKNIKSFLKPLNNNEIYFCSNLKYAKVKGLDSNSKIYIWGKKEFKDVEEYCVSNNIKLHRVEDGFIRSVTLGSDLTKAYSLVIDSRGIYFDPSNKSDLEDILLTYEFDDKLIARAKAIKKYILKSKLSKYNIHADTTIELDGKKPYQKVILVPGQVEDDASIIYGANGMSNLELLQQTRANKPDEFIIYKPHPDVLSGNRKGHIDTSEAMKFCDIIIYDASLHSILEICDEVHTMTSLVGFEGLLRDKIVYTYGKPFYAGWGLTHDKYDIPRRTRKLTLLELVAATYILYPRYINPSTNKLCDIEVVMDKVNKEKNRYNSQKSYKFIIDTRNFISRKVQLVIKWGINILETIK